MITALMLYSLVLGALVALGAWAIDGAARRALLPRRWAWAGALVLLVGLTLSAPWRAVASGDAIALSELPMATTNAAVAVAPEPAVLTTLVNWLNHPLRAPLAFVNAQVPAVADQTVGWLWAVSSLLALVATLTALRRLDRARKGWPHATVLGHPVRVAQHDGPAVYGVLRPEIVLPTSLLAHPIGDQQLVLVHEEEHRRAHDPLLLALSAFAVALMPWHPLAWWCAARLRLAVELDCDDRVLLRGVHPRQYGHVLLSLATSVSTRRGLFPALALLDSRSHLERRLLAMTSRPSRRTPLHLALCAVLGVSITAVACNTDVPTAAQIEAADVDAVTQTLGVSSAADRTVYLVDGTPTIAEEARALRADQIASVDVRGTADPAVTEVRIATNKGMPEQEVLVETLPEATGTLEIRTKSPADGEVVTVLEKQKGDASTILLRGTASPDAQPLVVLDGVVQPSSPDALRDLKLNPDRIDRIEIIKGPAALTTYGDAGRNGVIVITSKKKQ